MPVHWMRLNENAYCWAMFRERGDGAMDVKAALGGSTVYDVVMNREDARTLWARLYSQRWHKCTAAELEAAGMGPHKLGHIIRERQSQHTRPNGQRRFVNHHAT